MDATMNAKKKREGVEERKEDDYDYEHDQAVPLPNLLGAGGPQVKSAPEAIGKEDDDAQSGFSASVESIAKAIFGGCGQVVEAASLLVQGECRWPSRAQQGQKDKGAKPALSIAEDLKKLALKEGRPLFQPQPVSSERTKDIPKFLGEDAVYSFEDDNISAISQHTLEEMVSRNGVSVLHPICRQSSGNSIHTPPSPTRTTSLSTTSSDKRRRSRHKDERSV
jgi:hypothetical protein